MIRKVLLLVAFLNIYAFAMGKGPSLVETVILQKQEVNPLQEFVGTLNFNTKSTLAAQNSGAIKNLYFEVGDEVKKGKILVQIDDDLLNAQINAAIANLENAKQKRVNATRDLNRYKKLLQSKSITQKEFDDALLASNTANSSVKALEAKLKELKIQRYKKRVQVPFSGVVVERYVDVGEWVNAGSKIAKVIDPKRLKITFSIPYSIVKGIKKGQDYDIKVGDEFIKAKLNAIIPSGDKLTRTFPVEFKAKVKDSFVFDNQEATVKLPKNAKMMALVLPRDAVIKRFNKRVVFEVTKDNTAKMIPVQIIGFMGKKVAVQSPMLKEGMQIVEKGNERVFPKSKVKVINKQKD